ncbi:hypothetical protein V6N11_067680 [Hibiscus sabdariffa]|uniref:Uncharacterized protein n=1 Tax=Hibiscus sabdariffa TaxID=183260 RepID=A0ABR2SRH1_9ROSI
MGSSQSHNLRAGQGWPILYNENMVVGRMGVGCMEIGSDGEHDPMGVMDGNKRQRIVVIDSNVSDVYDPKVSIVNIDRSASLTGQEH